MYPERRHLFQHPHRFQQWIRPLPIPGAAVSMQSFKKSAVFVMGKTEACPLKVMSSYWLAVTRVWCLFLVIRKQACYFLWPLRETATLVSLQQMNLLVSLNGLGMGQKSKRSYPYKALVDSQCFFSL